MQITANVALICCNLPYSALICVFLLHHQTPHFVFFQNSVFYAGAIYGDGHLLAIVPGRIPSVGINYLAFKAALYAGLALDNKLIVRCFSGG